MAMRVVETADGDGGETAEQPGGQIDYRSQLRQAELEKVKEETRMAAALADKAIAEAEHVSQQTAALMLEIRIKRAVMFVDEGGAWVVDPRLVKLLREEKRTQIVKNIRTNKTDAKRLKSSGDGPRQGRRPERGVPRVASSRPSQPSKSSTQPSTSQKPST